MYKFLVKVALVIIGVYLLIKIPYFNDVYQNIRTAFDEKVQNVTAEVQRIKAEITSAKQKVDETKAAITDVAEKVKSGAQAVEGAVETVSKLGGGSKDEAEIPEADGSKAETEENPAN